MENEKQVLIVDLEGTCCDDDSIRSEDRETIEIGAVVLDLDSKEVTSEFGCFVRPFLNPVLTGFCKSLTTISQEDVDSAEPFKEAWLGKFIPWVGERKEFCSWGEYDLHQFQRDCGRSGLWLHFERHCNLVRMYGRRAGHRKAMKVLGIKPSGTHHRGLDDARNIAEIAVKMFKDGKRFDFGKVNKGS